MEIKAVCGTVIRENETKVINYLRKCEAWPSIEEISKETGLHENRVKRSLHIITQQMSIAENRKNFKNLHK